MIYSLWPGCLLALLAILYTTVSCLCQGVNLIRLLQKGGKKKPQPPPPRYTHSPTRLPPESRAEDGFQLALRLIWGQSLFQS